MARIKTGELKQHEKILTLMLNGKPLAVKDIKTLLGKEIEMYRLSAYILGIKYDYKGVIKTAKNGRNVLSYQLMNADEVKTLFMEKQPKHVNKVPATDEVVVVTKLADLKAEPVKQKKQKKQKVEETLEITEITE
jgi:predicted transcriptional regulator